VKRLLVMLARRRQLMAHHMLDRIKENKVYTKVEIK
jgi:hypothetical protein